MVVIEVMKEAIQLKGFGWEFKLTIRVDYYAFSSPNYHTFD